MTNNHESILNRQGNILNNTFKIYSRIEGGTTESIDHKTITGTEPGNELEEQVGGTHQTAIPARPYQRINLAEPSGLRHSSARRGGTHWRSVTLRRTTPLVHMLSTRRDTLYRRNAPQVQLKTPTPRLRTEYTVVHSSTQNIIRLHISEAK